MREGGVALKIPQVPWGMIDEWKGCGWRDRPSPSCLQIKGKRTALQFVIEILFSSVTVRTLPHQ